MDINTTDSIDDAYIVFTKEIAKMRKHYATKNNNETKEKTVTQSKVSYNQILKAATEYLVNDTELLLNEKEVYPTANLSKDLRIDKAIKIQMIKYVEDKFKLEQIDEDKILNRKLTTLQQFCLALHLLVNGKLGPEQPTLLQRIKQKFIQRIK